MRQAVSTSKPYVGVTKAKPQSDDRAEVLLRDMNRVRRELLELNRYVRLRNFPRAPSD